MVSKVAIFFLVSYVAMQEIYGGRIEDISYLEKSIFGDIKGFEKEIFKKSAEKLKKLMDDARHKVEEEIKKLEIITNTINETSNAVISNNTKEISKVCNDFEQKITQLQEKAVSLGSDITACGIDKLSTIRDTPNMVIEKTTECVNVIADKAAVLVKDTTNNCKEILEKGLKIGQDLIECRNSIPQCLLEMAVQTTTGIVHLPGDIAHIINQAITSDVEIAAEITKCAGEIVEKSVTEVGNVGAGIVECIEEGIANVASKPKLLI